MVNLLDRLSPFKGNIEDGLIHNWLLPGKPALPGWPIGITCDAAKAIVGLDLTLQRVLDDNVNVKGVGCVGLQGIGKTFLGYKLLYTWSGEDVGGGIPRVAADSLKHNNAGRPETAPLIVDLFGCTVIQVKYIRLNPLSRLWDMTLNEQYNMVIKMIEVDSKRRPKAIERNVLDACLKINYGLDNPSFPTLVQILCDYEAPVSAKADEDSKKPRLHKRMYKKWQAQLLEKAAFDLSQAIENLGTASYGSVFSDADDALLLKLIEQRAQSWDFKDIDDVTRSVIEVFRGAVEMSALAPKDPGNPKSGPKHPERLPKYILRDEAYNAWFNKFFADAEFLRMKTLREHDITLVMCFQHLSDFTEAVGSTKARNVLKEIPVWLVGRQHEMDLPDLRKFLKLPWHVLNTLPTLPKGHFWLSMPGRAPVLIFIMGTDVEIEHFVTNQANLALLKRYFETHDTKQYVNWLKDTSPAVDTPTAAPTSIKKEKLDEETIQV